MKLGFIRLYIAREIRITRDEIEELGGTKAWDAYDTYI